MERLPIRTRWFSAAKEVEEVDGKKLMERSRGSGRGEEEWRGEEMVGEVR
jgi:hypothetical protein